MHIACRFAHHTFDDKPERQHSLICYRADCRNCGSSRNGGSPQNPLPQ
ncbi:hypothetical protein X971_1322 [Agrobacterium tumefaciens LBA4213 (Ach5)]|nr:hypothetical protein X971_1322 [Agrobacterium tumefaciens LBA4213 (Ach5)]